MSSILHSRNWAVALILCGTSLLSTSQNLLAAEITQPSGVVELFTSQGCHSCPPADRVLHTLAEDGETLALAWHVDYWDYLGWKDTFGSAKSTKRQQAYARSFGSRSVYTPQAVINGHTDVVGSKGKIVEDKLQQYSGTSKGLTVPIDASISDGMLKIRIDAAPAAKDATLWMVYYDNMREVQIERGENRGKKLKYANIVRNIEMIGMVHEQTLQTEFALKDMGRRGHESCALILQKSNKDGSPGPIIGAAFIKDMSS